MLVKTIRSWACLIYICQILTSPALSQALPHQLFPSGPLNGITDVAGVRVAHITHISGSSGTLIPGVGPVRTGATVILANDDPWNKRVAAATYALNGNGELTGTHWIGESGFLEVPIVLTDTLDVGQADDGVISWMIRHHPHIGIDDDVPLPVVGECDDQLLNDIQGRHVTANEIVAALDNAKPGQFARGSVGAGTGMILFGFKGGIGSASRTLAAAQGGYTVGVLVNANNGSQPRRDLIIDGVAVGRALDHEFLPIIPRSSAQAGPALPDGSIIVLIATNAPLDARRLNEIALRAVLGLGRTGLTSRTSERERHHEGAHLPRRRTSGGSQGLIYSLRGKHPAISPRGLTCQPRVVIDL